MKINFELYAIKIVEFKNHSDRLDRFNAYSIKLQMQSNTQTIPIKFYFFI